MIRCNDRPIALAARCKASIRGTPSNTCPAMSAPKRRSSNVRRYGKMRQAGLVVHQDWMTCSQSIRNGSAQFEGGIQKGQPGPHSGFALRARLQSGCGLWTSPIRRPPSSVNATASLTV